MNTIQSWNQKICSGCKRMHCQKWFNCDWEPQE